MAIDALSEVARAGQSAFGDTVVAGIIVAGVLDLSAVTAETIAVALTANITSIVLPAGVAGKRKDLIIQFTQDGTGGRTVAGWPVGTLYERGTAPTIASPANAATLVALSSMNGSVWTIFGGASTSSDVMMLRIPTTARLVAGCTSGAALTSAAVVASRIYYIPFSVPRKMTITAMGINVVTLLAGTATVGIYAADGHAKYDYPGTLLAACTAGALNTSTTGTKTASVSCTLTPGVTYFAAVICSVAVVARNIPVGGVSSCLGFTDNAATVIACYYSAGATNVLSSTAGAALQATAAPPVIYLIE